MFGSEEENNRRSVGKHIGFLSRAAHRYLKHSFKDYSIGHAQVLTLHFISRNNGLNQNELGHYLNLDKSSVTSQLNILEKNGYVIRKPDKNDFRGRRIFITEKTKALQPKLYERFSEWSKILLDGFTKEEIEFIYSFLGKMITNANKAFGEFNNNEKKK
ncbi:MarR family transcriptional regulator [Maribellus comscasis]|uniref:MarR family transcriptional regulator n=1 Tax=Maribellus comscasis TaxID=2681766 RepID=A0A6I6JPZ6_9BACT|nr:MarR family transcriptional regulator [Maribellus comscasis]QGY42187.1 MarR family transcriptional regulator [Maribellus comscasis]